MWMSFQENKTKKNYNNKLVDWESAGQSGILIVNLLHPMSASSQVFFFPNKNLNASIDQTTATIQIMLFQQIDC